MNLDTFLDSTFNAKLCLTLLHSLWQAPLLAVIAAGLDRLSRRRSVERSYAVHTLALGAALLLLPVTYVLVDVAVPPTVAVDMNPEVTESSVVVDATTRVPSTPTDDAANQPGSVVQAQPEQALVAASVPAIAPPPTVAADETPSVWSTVATWIAGLYAAGVVVMLIRLWRGFWQADRLVATATPLQDGPILGLLQALAHEWSLRAVPALAVAERIVVPQVVGLLRPTILLPASTLTGLSTDELRMILAHELAHIRRHDLWINLLQRLAETVLFFNPTLWYLNRRISALREFCCDEQICRTTTESESDLRTRYATALLHVAELSQRPPREPQPTDLAALAAAGRSPSELRRRIAHLFGEPIREPLRLSRGSVLTLCAATLLLFAGPAIWQSRSESTTQADDAEKSGRVLRFPEGRTLGVVYIRPAATSEFGYDRNWYQDWEQLAPARGKVVIPEGQHVRLDVSNAASVDLSPLSSLPPDGIQALWLRGTDVTDDELKHIGHLDGLKFLDLEQTKISDAGIQYLSGLHELQQLKLSAFNVNKDGYGVGDDAMTVVAQLPALESIDLRLTKVTDAGLADLAKCKALRNVGLEGTPVTDDGLKHLLKLPHLTWLSLGVYDDGANITDAGMETVAQLTGLTILNLSGTPITNEGLKPLATLTNLERLAIDETQCTEEGLVHLEPLQKLENIRLFDNVTDVGAEHLSKLKGLKRISANLDVSDAGVIQFATLPHLEQLMLMDERITDASLASIAGMPELKWLWFQRCRVSDRGIAMLRNSESIEFLLIHETDMTFEGLRHLQTLPNLKILALDLTAEADGNWQILTEFPALEDLRIDGSAVGNKDVAALAGITTLRQLDLDLAEPLDDTGMAAMQPLTKLTRLRVEASVATDRGLTALSEMNSLEYLTLSCLATDEGLKSLYGLKSLRFLQIASPYITEAGIAKLTQSVPSLQKVNHYQYRLQNQPVSVTTKDRFFRQGTPEDRVPQDALEDKPAPPLFVENWLNVRGAVPMPERLKGRVVLVNFWHSRCSHCQKKPLELNRLYDKYHDQGLEIIGVHTTAGSDSIGDYFIKHAVTWPVCTDVADQTAAAWKVDNNHGYYLLDKTGRLRYADVFEGHLEDAVKSLLAEVVEFVPIKVVVAQHVMLFEGREIVTWDELEQKMAALPDPSLAHPNFYITRGAREAGIDKDARDSIWKLRGNLKLNGHSMGSLWPRSDRRYDQIKTAPDLVPDESLRIDGQVVDSEGKPVAGAEVILVTPMDEPIDNKTYYLALVEGHVYNPVDHVLTRSDAAGSFSIYPPKDSHYYVVAMHPDVGFSLMPESQFADDRQISLQAWAGLVCSLSQEGGKQSATLSTRLGEADGRPQVSITQHMSVLNEGKRPPEFFFQHVPPVLETSISRSFAQGEGVSLIVPGASVSLEPGEIRNLELGPLDEKQLQQLERRRLETEQRLKAGKANE